MRLRQKGGWCAIGNMSAIAWISRHVVELVHAGSAARHHTQSLRRSRSPSAPDLASVPRGDFGELVAEGLLYRTGRGLYGLASRAVSEHRSLAEAAALRRLSAPRHSPFTRSRPRTRPASGLRWTGRLGVRISITRLSRWCDSPTWGLVVGVETQLIDGVTVKVTGVSRTVVDCFKYRNKLGLDLASSKR